MKNIIYIILTLMASPLSAETVAITDQASQLKFPGKFVWADLLTTEPEKAARFYETVFGWEASIVDEEYLILYNKGKRIGGIARRVALGRQYIDHDHLV